MRPSIASTAPCVVLSDVRRHLDLAHLLDDVGRVIGFVSPTVRCRGGAHRFAERNAATTILSTHCYRHGKRSVSRARRPGPSTISVSEFIGLTCHMSSRQRPHGDKMTPA